MGGRRKYNLPPITFDILVKLDLACPPDLPTRPTHLTYPPDIEIAIRQFRNTCDVFMMAFIDIEIQIHHLFMSRAQSKVHRAISQSGTIKPQQSVINVVFLHFRILSIFL